MVEVEKRSLRTFEQDVLSAREALLNELRRVGQMRREAAAPFGGLLDQLVEVEAVDAMLALEGGVLLRQDAGQLAAKRRAVQKVLHADADPPRAVRVGGPDSPARGADGGVRQPGFHRSVEGDVVGHDHVGVLADTDPVDLEAAAGQHVQLGDERGRVHDDAVADHGRDVRVEHAGRDEVELEDLLAEHDRVAGVVAALVADDGRDVLGQEVGRLTFAFVAPLEADDHCGGHLVLPSVLAPAAVTVRTPGNQKALDRAAGDLGRLPLRRSRRGSLGREGGGSSHGANGTPSCGNVHSLAIGTGSPGFLGPQAGRSIAGAKRPTEADSRSGRRHESGRCGTVRSAQTAYYFQ